MQFLAPEKAGRYTYRLHVLSNAYAGLDQVMEIPFEVKPKADVRTPLNLGNPMRSLASSQLVISSPPLHHNTHTYTFSLADPRF